jgi:glucan phosphoethanolaminetransferase (alkaline phosphatase superfamily)
MNYLSSRFRWLRILGAALAVVALSFLILTVITAVYAFVLAFQTRGAPDQTAISHFAARVNPKLMPWLEGFLTLLVAVWVTRRTQEATTIDGLLIGILAGLLSLAVILAFHGRLGLHTLLFSLIVVGLGWLGGFVGQKRTGRT